MDKIVTAFLIGFGAIALVLILVPLATLFGGFTGWVVGIFFEDTIRNTLLAIGIDLGSVTMFQIGATLGFVGSFFKSTNTNTNS